VRVLVLGAAGIVGRATVAEAGRRGWDVRGLGRDQCDLGAEGAPARAAADFRPELLVNCAAFTRVDACESEPELAMAINGEAVGRVAMAAASVGARLIHLSTDYVFDGTAREPYPEEHPTAPRSAYGRSKRVGEQRALAVPGSLVVRTSWIFGPGGPNFVDTIRRKLEEGTAPLQVVDDQIGAPTYAPFLARALADLGESGAGGIVHYRNREPVSWFGFARAIARGLGHDPAAIEPATTAEVPRPAPRPAWSVLDVRRFERLAGRPVERWEDGLAAYLGSTGEKRR
jgi:dTDP-4-dehydrorhamnose reductase